MSKYKIPNIEPNDPKNPFNKLIKYMKNLGYKFYIKLYTIYRKYNIGFYNSKIFYYYMPKILPILLFIIIFVSCQEPLLFDSYTVGQAISEAKGEHTKFAQGIIKSGLWDKHIKLTEADMIKSLINFEYTEKLAESNELRLFSETGIKRRALLEHDFRVINSHKKNDISTYTLTKTFMCKSDAEIWWNKQLTTVPDLEKKGLLIFSERIGETKFYTAQHFTSVVGHRHTLADNELFYININNIIIPYNSTNSHHCEKDLFIRNGNDYINIFVKTPITHPLDSYHYHSYYNYVGKIPHPYSKKE